MAGAARVAPPPPSKPTPDAPARTNTRTRGLPRRCCSAMMKITAALFSALLLPGKIREGRPRAKRVNPENQIESTQQYARVSHTAQQDAERDGVELRRRETRATLRRLVGV